MSSFTITAPVKKTKLNVNGATVVPITVTNVSKKSVRGTPKLKAIGGAVESWFSLRNNATVTFPPEASEQFQVEIKVPAGTPPGEYTFGLNVSNEAIPEDDFAEGPPVSFELEATKPLPPPPPRRWIFILVAVVVLGGAATMWLWPKKQSPLPDPAPKEDPGPPATQNVKVPRLIGLNPEGLSTQRQDLIYRKADAEYTGKQPAGLIAEQDPNPDVEVQPGHVVLYTVEAQSPLVGTWLPVGPPSSTVARYVISQRGTEMFVRVFEKGTPNPSDRGEREAARSANRLVITWRGGAVPSSHQQTLTITGDGRLLVEEGTSRFIFQRRKIDMRVHRAELSDSLKINK